MHMCISVYGNVCICVSVYICVWISIGICVYTCANFPFFSFDRRCVLHYVYMCICLSEIKRKYARICTSQFFSSFFTGDLIYTWSPCVYGNEYRICLHVYIPVKKAEGKHAHMHICTIPFLSQRAAFDN